MRKKIFRNMVPIIIGGLLTAVAVKYMYGSRGYFSIGGEWLVLPFTILLFKQAESMKDEAYELLIEPLVEMHRQRARRKTRKERKENVRAMSENAM